METDRFARARVLIEQRRYDLAANEVAARLGDAPDDPEGHILLAICQNALNRPQAVEAARRAVELAPDDSRAHFVVGLTETRRGNLAEAEAAIRRAISLDSWNAGYFGQLAAVHIAQFRWADALAAADEGLALDPDDDVCLNNRAVALTQLGRHADAARSLEGTLEKHPEDAFTHANRGWTLLHENDPAGAAAHFREALRLDPTSDWARRGMLESLRARSWVYRRVLQFTLWMSRFPPRVQLALTLGLLVVVSTLDGVGRQVPAAEPFLGVLLFGYAAFVGLSWFAKHVANVLLLLSRDGRVLLGPAERWVSGVCTLLLALVLALVGVAVVTRSPQAVAVALLVFVAGVHFASATAIPAGRFRRLGLGASGVVIALFAWERVNRFTLIADAQGVEARAVEFDRRLELFDAADPELKARWTARNARTPLDRLKGDPPPDPELDDYSSRRVELLRERLQIDAEIRQLRTRAEGLNTLQTIAALGSVGVLVLHSWLTARATRRQFG